METSGGMKRKFFNSNINDENSMQASKLQKTTNDNYQQQSENTATTRAPPTIASILQEINVNNNQPKCDIGSSSSNSGSGGGLNGPDFDLDGELIISSDACHKDKYS